MQQSPLRRTGTRGSRSATARKVVVIGRSSPEAEVGGDVRPASEKQFEVVVGP